MFNTKVYLTEENLVEFTKEFVSQDLILDKQFKPYKFRPDVLIQKQKIILEFDGYLHYTQPNIILKDYEKNNILKNLGYKIIRIPYFVQLDEKTIKYIFPDLLVYRISEYPHGFIDKKAILPAAFCELGIKRFIDDLEKFNFIKNDIIESLENKIKELGNILLVYPPSMINK